MPPKKRNGNLPSVKKVHERVLDAFNGTGSPIKLPDTPTKNARERSGRNMAEQYAAVNAIAVNSADSPFTKETVDIHVESEYVLEVAAQVILARRLANFKLWTPFGECNIRCRGTIESRNYFVSIGRTRSNYGSLLENIKDEKIINTCQKFLLKKFSECSVEKVTLVNALTIDKINAQLREMDLSGGQNKSAAIMCGIFVVEMMRTSGKDTRAGFREWPDNVGKLKDKFVQANRGGNLTMRKLILGLESVSQEDKAALQANVSLQSPIKPKALCAQRGKRGTLPGTPPSTPLQKKKKEDKE